MEGSIYWDAYGGGWTALIGLAALMAFLWAAIAIATVVLQALGMWRALAKAGEPGWKALVPVYNTYTLFGIAWRSREDFYILLGTSVGTAALMGLSSACTSAVLAMLLSLTTLGCMGVSVAWSVRLNVRVARAFGREDAFGAGLVLLAPIFWMVLGLGKSEYVGIAADDASSTKDNDNDDERGELR